MIRICILAVAVLSPCMSTPAAAQMPEVVVLLVSSKSGLKSVADFVVWTKRSKKPLAYSSSGPESRRFGETLSQKLSIKTVHVPYRGAQDGIFDLIGGHIDFSLADVDHAAGQIQGGLVTPLAVAGKRRFPRLPDVPTFAEAGYPELAAVAGSVRAASLNPASQMVEQVIVSHRPVHNSWSPPAHARY